MNSNHHQPDVTRRLTVTLSDGASVSVRRWGPERERRIVISHGNGLAADGLWDFGRELLAQFEVVAFDLRNHGQSQPADQPENPWPRYIADIPEIFDAIADRLGARETHGAFHSMSSACTLIAQTLTARPWASLTLFEPPIAPASLPELVKGFSVLQRGLAERTLARRQEFPEPEVLARSFSRAPTFAGIDPEAILQLARATLSQTDTGWQLACPAEFEASNFAAAVELVRHWNDFARIEVPVQLILGDEAVHDMPLLPAFGREMERSFGFSALTCPGANHFMQLQQPQWCARQVIAFAKSNSAFWGGDAVRADSGRKDETARGSAGRV